LKKKIERRRKLLLLENRNPKQQKELRILEEELEDLPVTETTEAIRAMEIIRKAAKNSVV
jgi:hypothetical protein